jgi:hypothetical protein
MVTAIIWIAAIRIEEASAAPKNIRAVSWLAQTFFSHSSHSNLLCETSIVLVREWQKRFAVNG